MKTAILPRPYPEDACINTAWDTIAVQQVRVAELIPTQECVAINRVVHLLAGGEPEAGDRALHLVADGGQLFIHDGHTRWLIAALRGAEMIESRIALLAQTGTTE